VARQSWKKSEKAGCVAFSLFTLAVVGSKICYVLSEQGLYFGLLRKVYDISKMYL
jgi:energy-coupling factor transport system permease protein